MGKDCRSLYRKRIDHIRSGVGFRLYKELADMGADRHTRRVFGVRFYMFRIGCHLSIAEGYFKALQNILSIGGNTYQYFSRNPQGGKAKAFNQTDFDHFIACAKDNQVDGLLCHAPYTLNPASEKENVREFA